MFVSEGMVYAITLADDKLDNSIDPTAYANLTHVQVASLLVGFVLPLVNALVIRSNWSRTTRSLVLLALSAITGFLTELINDPDFVWQRALVTSLMTFIVAVGAYFGLWKETGIQKQLLAMFNKPTGAGAPAGPAA